MKEKENKLLRNKKADVTIQGRNTIKKWNIGGEPFSENQIKKIMAFPKNDPKGCWKKYFAKPKPVAVDEFEINDDLLDLFFQNCKVDCFSINEIVCWFLTHSPYFKIKHLR